MIQIDTAKGPEGVGFKPGYEALGLRDLFQSQNPQNIRLAELLHVQLYDVFKACFPDANEREPLETQARYLKDPADTWDIIVYRPVDGPVSGGRIVNHFETAYGHFGVGEHLFINQAHRQSGLGTDLVKRTEQILVGRGIVLMLSEQNDPALMTQVDCSIDQASGISPEVRLQFWKRLGYLQIDAPYLQPPTDHGGMVRYLLPALKTLNFQAVHSSAGLTSDSIATSTYLSLLRSFHGNKWVADIDCEPACIELKTLLQEAERRGITALNLIEIDRPRTFTQTRKAPADPERPDLSTIPDALAYSSGSNQSRAYLPAAPRSLPSSENQVSE